MQIALHDIRRIGYQKLFDFYTEDIIEDIKKLNTHIYSFDKSSFSVLNNWQDHEESITKYYYGFCSLVNNYTPMVSELGADTISKRKFRNTWVKMWNYISKDIDIPDTDMTILSDCGIRLVYYVSELYNSGETIESELYNVLNFYNSLFKWTIFSDKELNFKKNKMTHIDVLELLALNSPSKFNNIILTEIC